MPLDPDGKIAGREADERRGFGASGPDQGCGGETPALTDDELKRRMEANLLGYEPVRTPVVAVKRPRRTRGQLSARARAAQREAETPVYVDPFEHD